VIHYINVEVRIEYNVGQNGLEGFVNLYQHSNKALKCPEPKSVKKVTITWI